MTPVPAVAPLTSVTRFATFMPRKTRPSADAMHRVATPCHEQRVPLPPTVAGGSRPDCPRDSTDEVCRQILGIKER